MLDLVKFAPHGRTNFKIINLFKSERQHKSTLNKYTHIRTNTKDTHIPNGSNQLIDALQKAVFKVVNN